MFDSRANKIPGVDLSLETLNPASLAATAVRNAVNRSINDVVPESSLCLQMSKVIKVKNNVQLKVKREKEARFLVNYAKHRTRQNDGHSTREVWLNAGLTWLV